MICVNLYQIQNFLYTSHRLILNLDYCYINKYLYVNWWTRIQSFLLMYSRFYIYIILNVYFGKKNIIDGCCEQFGIYLHQNLLFLIPIRSRFCLLHNLLFLFLFSQFNAIVYYFRQYFQSRFDIYHQWLNLFLNL